MNTIEEKVKQTISDKVKNIIWEQVGVNKTEITSDKSFMDDLGCDSLDCIEVIMAVEEDFDIEISDEKAVSLKTVGDLEIHLLNMCGEGIRGRLKPDAALVE